MMREIVAPEPADVSAGWRGGRFKEVLFDVYYTGCFAGETVPQAGRRLRRTLPGLGNEDARCNVKPKTRKTLKGEPGFALQCLHHPPPKMGRGSLAAFLIFP